jgi:hypothetical protein
MHVLLYPISASPTLSLEDRASNMSISKRGRSPSPPLSPVHPRPHQRHSSSRYNDRDQQQARSGRKASNFHGEPDAKRRRGDKDQGFRDDARDQPPRVYSPCTLCLGRHKHNVWSCASPTLWDLQPARCVKVNGRLQNPAGVVLCSDWQAGKCDSPSHTAKHECSGCGSSSHGAHKCHLAEKA